MLPAGLASPSAAIRAATGIAAFHGFRFVDCQSSSFKFLTIECRNEFTHVTGDSNESKSTRSSGLAISHQPQFLDLMTTAFDPVFEFLIRYIEGQITDK